MKKIFITLNIIFILFFSEHIFAVTAKPGFIIYSQPDGSTLNIEVKGDEFIHWAVSIDGYTLLPNNFGVYEYAMLTQDNKMVLSGIQANDPKYRSFKEINFLNSITTDLFYTPAQVSEIKAKCIIKPCFNMKMGGFPTTGTRKLLLILANFNNTTPTYTQTQFDNYMNQSNYNGIGCFKDFYYQNSYNLLTINTTVTVWVTVPNTHNYYGPEGKWPEFVRDAVIAADNAGVDFSQFDNDNDGDVDGIAVIHQGRGQEESGNTNDIWSHSSALASGGFPNVNIDGKIINDYTCQPEKLGSSAMTSIGVMCHEFGHNLGAPDFYDTDYNTGGNYAGTGDWDVMANGSWNDGGARPAMHNAWTKEFYTWTNPTIISSSGNNLQIRNAETYQDAFKFFTYTSNEFYLLENRQQTGFDQSIPGHGLIIYHVDGNHISSHIFSNNINAGSHQGLYPVCASTTSGNPPSTYGNINSGGCPFPGTSNKTSFTDVTTPWAKSWAGENSLTPINSISENNQIITFNVAFNGNFLPVVDFSTGGWNIINEGEFVDFYDFSSYSPTSWTWTFNGGTPSSSTLQHPSHIVYNTAGSYNVTLTVSNPFGTGSLTKNNYIIVNPLTSLNTSTLQQSINIYPNPVKDIFTLELNSSINETYLIYITDILGNKVFESNLSKNLTSFKLNIDLSSQNNGIYYLIVQSNKDKAIKKIVLNK